MQHQLFGLRGKAYVQKYKELYESLKEPIKTKFEEVKLNGNKFTPKDLGKLAVEFCLPVKVLSEYMEGYGLLPTGTWESLQARGCRVADLGVVWGKCKKDWKQATDE